MKYFKVQISTVGGSTMLYKRLNCRCGQTMTAIELTSSQSPVFSYVPDTLKAEKTHVRETQVKNMQPMIVVFFIFGWVALNFKIILQTGGPLMLEMDGRWVQIGIVSFGNRCAEAGYPGDDYNIKYKK